MQRAEASEPDTPEAEPSQVVRLVLPDLRGVRRRRRVAAAAVLAIVAIGTVLAWWSFDDEVDRIRAEPVVRRGVVRTVAITGHIDVERRIEVAAPAPGLLNRIEVRAGDRV